MGANLWIVCAGWPLVAARAEPTAALLADLLSLAPLALGALAGRAGPRLRALQATLWLTLFPAGLATALALRPERLNAQLFGPLGLVLLALSLYAYAGAAAHSLRAGVVSLAATHTALGNEPWDAAPLDREARRRAVISAWFAGAIALGVVAPMLGGAATGEGASPEQAAAAGVLAAVVGCALGATLLAVYLPVALRPHTAAELDARGDAGLRVSWFLFLALLGGVTYYVVTP